ncbi:cytidine deaminase [Mediterraneibacter glycyrrhizinilyticus]|nr:cytidine deaminase [Mediterraneibacter glycyrrhizinilyticus]MBM6855164.1 cytidine deaminase [Mediterraneibacter glycyrrhizinilyticus]
MDFRKLIERALAAREYSYSPYSHFRVGAALLCQDGSVYTGCNIENRAYGPTNCAERTAFFKAVSEGKREFAAIAIVGGEDELVWCYPCGVCRQVMAEFCNGEEFKIICAKSADEYRIFSLNELLPEMF